MFAEECGGEENFVGVVDVSDGGEIFDAVREANLLRRELKSVDV